MTCTVLRGLVVCALVSVFSSHAFAQGATTSTLTGVVVDSVGGVIPGATVSREEQRDRLELRSGDAAAKARSRFRRSSAGTYTVTVSLQGFKTAVLSDVRSAARHTDGDQGGARRRAACRRPWSSRAPRAS